MAVRKRHKNGSEKLRKLDAALIRQAKEHQKLLPALMKLCVCLVLSVFAFLLVSKFVDRNQLLWRVDQSAKDGKSDKQGEKNTAEEGYTKASITNEEDGKIRDLLDKADGLLENHNDAQRALRLYEKLLGQHPGSPRAQYGKAQALNAMAASERSNDRLEQSIREYKKILNMRDVPKDLMVKAGKTLVDRQDFRGWNKAALATMLKLQSLYPSDINLDNEVGVRYSIVGEQEAARRLFKRVLVKDPGNGFAMVNLGFIVKTVDKDYSAAIPLMQGGIDSGADGTMEALFFSHLGDAYYRVGQKDMAKRTYEYGAEHHLFLSPYQRSLYNVESIKAQPWWTKEETGYAKHLDILEDNWRVIQQEGLEQLNMKTGAFQSEDEGLTAAGEWKQLTLFQQGVKNVEGCRKAPKTCALIQKFTDASGCRRGQVKYSVMHPGVYVWPHCGPTNCRIRAHLGLVVPYGPRIRVGEDTKTWEEGKFLIFDDSFEHEVWHNGDSLRLVLIVDMWHPELTPRQKATLSRI